MTDSNLHNIAIAAEAAEWHLDLQSEALSPARRGQFMEWLCRSPAHVEEFLRVVALQADLGRLAQFKNLDVDELLRQVARPAMAPNVVDFPMAARFAPLPPSDRRGRLPLRAGLAAAVGLSLVASLYWLTPFPQMWHGLRYETGAGEQRSVSLRDGSQVQINVRSDLEVQVDAQVREVHLQTGEALFKVAHDPTHPFRVHTPDAVIEAKGTRFDVRVRDGKTVVVLLEGRVEVTTPTRKSSDTGAAAILDPGDAVTVAADSRAALQPRRADVDAATAWVRRRLVFDDTPLELVVNEFNLYSVDPVIIDDPGAREVRVTTSFDAADPELFARSVAAAAALRASRHTDGTWHIERP